VDEPDRESAAAGPLSGVRVLEVSRERPARIAGMLLADLGADVLRVVGPGAPPEPLTPETVCWDRGKRVARIAADGVPGAAVRADVMVVDGSRSSLRGWQAEALGETHPSLVHVWMPPYGEHGEWKDLPDDPLLLAALGSLAVYYPADDDSPVAPIVAGLTHIQGALGASAAVAGLVGRQRTGAAQASVVTGLHAAAAVMGTAFAEINDQPAFSASRALRGAPSWRIYRCADGEWLFLAALTPGIFFRALEALDRLDVMALPEVAGDFQSILDLNRGRRAVEAELESVFAANTSAHWLARLQQARVPCTTVKSRAEWMDGPIVRGNHGRADLQHPSLGQVSMPNVPVILSDTPGSVRGFSRELASGHDVWPQAVGRPGAGPQAAAAPAAGPPGARGSLPLAGVAVVDASSFLAGPMVSAVLADFGADVVRVEPVGGDSYRNFSLAFLAVNQRKRGAVIDLKQPDGIEALHALLARADVFVENLRPRALAALALEDDATSPRFPRLVHCSVSAFGRAEAFADLPGFDPIFQCLNGMAAAQGAEGEPIVCPAPVNDVATGALGALGCLAALFRRQAAGRGQRVWVSLAASSTFIQSGEFTTWAGSPPTPRGDLLFRGPGHGHRYHQCRDGWIAVAAVSEALRAQLAAALGVDDLADAAGVLRGHTVASATRLLNTHGVPACRVVPRHRPLRDPFLMDNGFSHLVPVPEGVARVVDRHSCWPGAAGPRASRSFAPGEDTRAVLASAGLDPGGLT
jgi:crotonobetainyl-CoA:carnitine CoA-transferase CaiB-like acyl-CoA transferase